jgi:hypothetical protein
LNIKVHFNKNLLFVLGILDITYRWCVIKNLKMI